MQILIATLAFTEISACYSPAKPWWWFAQGLASLGPDQDKPSRKASGLGSANAKPGASLNRNDDKAKMLKNILERGEREGSPHNLIPHPDSTTSFSPFWVQTPWSTQMFWWACNPSDSTRCCFITNLLWSLVWLTPSPFLWLLPESKAHISRSPLPGRRNFSPGLPLHALMELHLGQKDGMATQSAALWLPS